jgi:hypothetical protein
VPAFIEQEFLPGCAIFRSMETKRIGNSRAIHQGAVRPNAAVWLLCQPPIRGRRHSMWVRIDPFCKVSMRGILCEMTELRYNLAS